MQRVIAYVDGFNLYFGLKAAGWKRYYWLDLMKLAQNLLRQDQQLAAVHYFTARIQDNGRNGSDRKRQNDYIEAVQQHGVSVQLGHYLPKPRKCHHCGAAWTDYEEKETDVNIAIQLLLDAEDGHFDTALLISADSDLTTPVRRLRERFPQKRVIAVFPPRRRSAELSKVANGHFVLGNDKLRASQLPATITKPDGYVLSRPATWK